MENLVLPDWVNTALQTAAAVCGAATVLLVFSLVIWTARDISARSRDQLVRVGAVLAVLLVPVVGLIAYVLLRPRETLADRYEREMVEEILARELTAATGREAASPRRS